MNGRKKKRWRIFADFARGKLFADFYPGVGTKADKALFIYTSKSEGI